MEGNNSSESESDQFFSKYDDVISQNMSQYHVAGLSLAIVHGDATHTKGYGIARLPDEQVTPKTIFNIGSMSKSFIAAAISLLVDDEENFPQMKWTTPVSQILKDDFVLSDSRYTEMVTIEDMLSHRTGLPDQDDSCFGIHAEITDTPKSVTRKLRHLPLTAPLRTKYQYCNIMYVVAVHLVETLTGLSIEEFLRQKIWEPLGMNNTYFGNDDVEKRGVLHQLAKGYGWRDKDSSFREIPWPIQPEAAGAGEIISNVEDVALYIRAMMRKNGPISENGHEELVKPRTITGCKMIPFQSDELYALGWETKTYHGETIIGHDGATNGFQSSMLYLPRLEWGIVILTNSEDAYFPKEKIIYSMIDDLLGIPTEKRFDWDKLAKEEEEEDKPKTKEDFYPNLPDPILPITSPLEKYAGKYKHAGYGVLPVVLEDGKLKADGSDRTWRFILELEHASGEFFVGNQVNIETLSEYQMKAQFTITDNGEVGWFGVKFVEEMHDFIWFERMQEK